jgi:hypothetical protein
MSDGKLDFLDGKPEEDVAGVTPEVEASPEETPTEPESTGDTGSTPEPQIEKPKTPEVSHMAPLTALLDEREKRQAAEREAQELRQWRQQIETQQRQAQRKTPDVFEDPQGFVQHTQQAFQEALLQNKLSTSRFLAEREFGGDQVKEAVAFFDANPQLSWQFLQEPSPYHAAVEFVRKQKLLQEIGSDPDKWKQSQVETLKEQIRQELMAEMQSPAPRRPPISLAAQPAAGRGEPQKAAGSAFDQAFGT